MSCVCALGASLTHQSILGKDCACFVVTRVVLQGAYWDRSGTINLSVGVTEVFAHAHLFSGFGGAG